MKDETFLSALEETAEKLSIKLSYEDLKKGEIDTHGGLCRLKDEKRILIHKGLTVREKIDILIEILSGVDTEGIHLPPDIREKLEAVKR